MTSDERYLFDLMGYLVVEDVLTAEELHDLNAHLDDYDLWSNHGNDPFHEVWTYEDSYLIVGPLHQWDEPFRRLLDHPKMLPYLVELLGPTFRLDISHAILMTKGGGKLHLHGGGTPYKAPTHYHFQDGKICCNLIVISYALRDATRAIFRCRRTSRSSEPPVLGFSKSRSRPALSSFSLRL
jgi:hypothetical protein